MHEMSLQTIPLIVVLILCVITLITMIASLLVFVPFVPTPMPVVKRMVALANLRGQETVYDLGCGDARILIEAKKQHPAIRAIGYELPIGVWLLAKARVALSGVDITVRMRDFRVANLCDADVIFLYLIPDVMPMLLRKLTKEARTGTTIISHGFELPGKEPVHDERVTLPSWNPLRPSGKSGPRVLVYKW